MIKRINNQDEHIQDNAAIIMVDHDTLTFLELFDLLERTDKLATVNFMAGLSKKAKGQDQEP